MSDRAIEMPRTKLYDTNVRTILISVALYSIALLSVSFDFSSLGAKTNLLLFFFVKKDIILYTEA